MALVLAVVVTSAGAAACYEDCLRQGYDRSYCASACDRVRGNPAPALIEQPGAPRNPYLDALPDPAPRQRPLPQRLDKRCFDGCQARGHDYGYCRKQCSY